jgi:hypothetical protein
VAELYAKLATDLYSGLFTQQVNLIDDPCRFKAACCTRRAGKSTTAIRYMLIVACRVPNANIQFITLTNKKARKEIWPDLKRTCRKFDLKAQFNEQMLAVRFPNGSSISLEGCENASEIDKFRGSDGGYDLVVIDECKSFAADMFKELLSESLVPALADRMGTLMIIGTPGRFLSGPFYDITSHKAFEVKFRRDDETGEEYRGCTSKPFEDEGEAWVGIRWAWSFHRWYTKDNIAKPHIWREQLAEKKKNGWDNDEPIWRREYQGEWVADDSGYVYAYLSERNDWEPGTGEDCNEFGLPIEHEWVYVEGSDLGFDDEFAIEVVAWSPTTQTFYLGVYEFTMPGMDVPAMAKAYTASEEKFGTFHARCGDRGGLGKTIFATLDNQYAIDIEPAEKHEKRDYQELLNSELRSGRAKVRKGSKLARQMASLQWKADGKTEDKDSSPKDACDAALYSWRYIYSAYSKPAPQKLRPGSAEAIHAQVDEHKLRLKRAAEKRDMMDDDEKFTPGWAEVDKQDLTGNWEDADGWTD